MKARYSFICGGLLLLAASSCTTTKDVQYIQDLMPNTVEATMENSGLIIEPDDLLSIIISTKNPELGGMFNLQPGTLTSDFNSTSNTRQTEKIDLGYRVDEQGNITFPQLGTLHVAGLNRRQLENMIKQRIIKEGLLKDFSVSVSFQNSKISILGDVASPGNYDFRDDKYTILQAIADAGDLNITAEREVLVVREKGGRRELYKVDLTSRSLFDSPAYYLQQNDLIYVLPNDVKAAQRDLNTNQWRQVSTWMGLASFLASMTSIIIAITK
ncbi:MAG: polysaccharide biosynthesis/export family protein [Prevotella sp.]|nr:polysaccharide biosynthesis/export family protein [Prevotella sp.]MCM1074939.1 polysaccharide biosynthesis/export family protein [Ruminococcus sp.]